MSLSKTWYSTFNRAIDDSSTAAKAAQSSMWAMLATLTGNISGTNGAEGARPSGAYWTLVGSSNSVSAGMDSTDRLHLTGAFTTGDWVRNTAGNAHTWCVLQSPSGLLDGPWYLCIDFIGPTNDQTCTFVIANNAFSGGSTTARPTATNEAAATSQQYSSSTAGAGKTHFSTDANGGFRFYRSRNGQGYFDFFLSIEPMVEYHSADVGRCLMIMQFNDGAPGAPALQGSWVLRGKQQDGAAGLTSGLNIMDGSTRPSGSTLNSLTSTNSLDSTVDAIPMMFFMDTTASHHGIRGRIPDMWLTGQQIVPGSTVPSGTPERMQAGGWLTVGSVTPSL